MNIEHDKHRTPLRRWFDWLMPRRGWVYGLSLVWCAASLITFFSLKRDLFPDMYLPTVQLLIQSPGRAASELELTIAQPVEQSFSGLPGVKRVTSTVQAGVVQTVIVFQSGTDPWRSRQLISEKLSSVIGGFPAGTGAPLMTSAAGRLQEIQEIVLEGPAEDPMRLRDYAIKVLIPRLQSVAGVARVELLGGQDRQLQITLLPERMRLLGAGLPQVLEAMEGTEQSAAAGILEIQDKSSFVVSASRAVTPEEARRIPVHTARGMVALGDLAEIRFAPGFRQGLARFQGHEVVSLRVIKQIQSEVISTCAAVRESLPGLQKALPEGMTLKLFYDQSDFVRHALGGVTTALLLGGFFVALVLLILLGSWRAVLVVITLLPLSILGAAIPLWFFGQGLNAMTLGGLAIAVGLLVDAGVIMVENLVHRLHEHRGMPEKRHLAIVRAAAEVGAPILTAVLVILAVFIPLLAIGGIAGKLYAPLAIAVASSMTLSLIFSFTLVPMLTEKLILPDTVLDEPPVVVAVKRIYAPMLDWALRHGALVMIIALSITIPTLWLALRLGTNYMPALNEGALLVQSIFTPDMSLQAVDDGNRLLEDELSGMAGVQSSYRRTGRGEITEDPMPHYVSDVLVVLKPGTTLAEMEGPMEEMAEKLPFALELTTPMGMKIAEGIGGTPADIQVKLFNPDLDALQAAIPEIGRQLAAIPGVASATPDTGGMLAKWEVQPDDDLLRRLDVPRQAVHQTLKAALQGIELEPWYDGPLQVERIIRFPSDGRVTSEFLKRLPVIAEEGRVIELGQIANFAEATTPSMIKREGGLRRLGFNVRVERDLGGTGKRIETALRQAKLPPGTTFAMGGKLEEARETQRRLTIAIFVALTLVMMLLYLALRSWREVFVIIITLPDAFAGGLLALWLMGETWNVSSIVGVIGLFGVAVQNSLVLITQAKGLLAEGMPFMAALREASIGRVRPKLMTAGSAILGLAPMLFGIGGSELERPLAIVMVGGLVTSTLFTLLVLPSFYAWVCAPRLDKSGADAAPHQQPLSDH